MNKSNSVILYIDIYKKLRKYIQIRFIANTTSAEGTRPPVERSLARTERGGVVEAEAEAEVGSLWRQCRESRGVID